MVSTGKLKSSNVNICHEQVNNKYTVVSSINEAVVRLTIEFEKDISVCWEYLFIRFSGIHNIQLNPHAAMRFFLSLSYVLIHCINRKIDFRFEKEIRLDQTTTGLLLVVEWHSFFRGDILGEQRPCSPENPMLLLFDRIVSPYSLVGPSFSVSATSCNAT